MKLHRFLLFPFLFAIILFSGGCTVALPVVTPAPRVLVTAQPVASSPVPARSTPASAASPVAPPPIAPTPAPTATPAPPAHPSADEALAAGLTYVQAGFKLKMPKAADFAPASPPDLASVEIETSLASGPWLVAIGPAVYDASGRGYRTIIISNEQGKQVQRWWGQVDEAGVASTVVFSGMPRPRSARIKGMKGKIVRLPAGSPYPRYFQNEKGQRFGIASNKENISALLAAMTAEDGRIQVWGELRYAVNDYNGRRILVRKYDLLDADPDAILARAQPQNPGAASAHGETDENLGPIAIVQEPEQWAYIHGEVQVQGLISHPAGEQVIVRVENAEEKALNSVAVPLQAAGEDATFSALVPFPDPPGVSSGRIAIYAPNASGEPLLLGWREVRFAGPVGNRRVIIHQPAAGAGIRGKVQVAGLAENVTSGQVLVRVEDAAGVVMGQRKVKVGPKGSWRSIIKFRRPKTPRSGVIAVYDITPEGGLLILLATQPVRLKR